MSRLSWAIKRSPNAATVSRKPAPASGGRPGTSIATRRSGRCGGPMPDRPAVALARRLAPPSLRRDVFDPAVRDLVGAVGRNRTPSWRLAALVADCWRLWAVALVQPDGRRL